MLKDVESLSLEQHFIIGSFTSGYLYEMAAAFAYKIGKICNRDILLGMVEDMLFDTTLPPEALEEPWSYTTTMSVNEFLYDGFFNDAGGNAGFLHITIEPHRFHIVFDSVDFPHDDPIARKFPDEKFAKSYKELYSVIRGYVDLRDSLMPDIEKAREKYKDMFDD